MSILEQQAPKQDYYQEALRYRANAREILQKGWKEGAYYQDEKYVKTACGIAYSGILKALDSYLRLKDVPRAKKRKSIDYYYEQIALLDKKLNVELKNASDILHLAGYYDGVTRVTVIQDGMSMAEEIISRMQA